MVTARQVAAMAARSVGIGDQRTVDVPGEIVSGQLIGGGVVLVEDAGFDRRGIPVRPRIGLIAPVPHTNNGPRGKTGNTGDTNEV